MWPWENCGHAQNGCFLSSENEGVGLDDLYSLALQASLIWDRRGSLIQARSESFLLCKTLPNQAYVKSPAPRLTTVTSPRSAPCQAVNKVQAAWLITLTPTRVSYPTAQELVLMIVGMLTLWFQAQPSPLQPTASFENIEFKQRIPKVIRGSGKCQRFPFTHSIWVWGYFPNMLLAKLCNHNR